MGARAVQPQLNTLAGYHPSRHTIALAFLAQVKADPDAARGEATLAERLEAYQAYPPTNRLTKVLR